MLTELRKNLNTSFVPNPQRDGKPGVYRSMRDPKMWLAIGVLVAIVVFLVLLIVLNER
jgi:uncharacterized protein YjgD (DUF1641 family)